MSKSKHLHLHISGNIDSKIKDDIQVVLLPSYFKGHPVSNYYFLRMNVYCCTWKPWFLVKYNKIPINKIMKYNIFLYSYNTARTRKLWNRKMTLKQYWSVFETARTRKLWNRKTTFTQHWSVFDVVTNQTISLVTY